MKTRGDIIRDIKAEVFRQGIDPNHFHTFAHSAIPPVDWEKIADAALGIEPADRERLRYEQDDRIHKIANGIAEWLGMMGIRWMDRIVVENARGEFMVSHHRIEDLVRMVISRNAVLERQ